MGTQLTLSERWTTYRKNQLRSDVTAGLTTAVMLIPQGMAYAMLAGLPPIVGLYAAAIPALGYAAVGTSRQLSVGPVATDSLLVAAGVGALAQAGTEQYVALAVLLAFMVGVLQLAMGGLRMGFVVNFLSHPVISGFTSAAALIIAVSQLRHILGIPLDSSQTVFSLVGEGVRRFDEVALPTLLIGVTSAAALTALKRFAPRFPRALAVVAGSGLVVWSLGLESSVSIVGAVPPGLPALQLPAISSSAVMRLAPTAVAIALVAFMESISVSEAYAKKNGYRIKPDRELMALGASNLLGGLFQGYPVTGGFSRTAVNAQSGAQTRLAAVITSGAVAVSLVFLTPLFYYLPHASLAAIIVVAVAGLIDFQEVVHLYKVKRSDLLLLVITFAATLGLGIVEGIGTGVLASLGWFVVRTTRPHIAELGRIPGTRIYRNVKRQADLIHTPGLLAVRMDAQFYFGNVSFLRSTLVRLEAQRTEPVQTVILDASAMNNLDSSAETALRELHEDYSKRGVAFYMTCIKGPVRDVLDRTGFSKTLGIRGEFRSLHDAVEHALAAGALSEQEAPQHRPAPGEVRGNGSGVRPAGRPLAPRATDGPAARAEALHEGYSYVI